jgi:hypothetical protein
MDGDLTSRDMNNGKGSNKGNLRLRSKNNSPMRKFSGNRDNLRFRSHNSHSLKENLEEGR